MLTSLIANADLMTQFQASPQVFIFGMLVWIPVAAWIIAMIQWMIMGDIDVSFGLASIAVALTLAYLTGHPPRPQLTPVFFGGVVVTVIIFPFVQKGLQKRELARLDIEQIEDLYENLKGRPDNLSALYRLSEVLWHRGIHGHALGLAESLLPRMDKAFFRTEHQQISHWRHQLGGNYTPRAVRCLACGTSIKPGPYLCPKCGGPFLLLYARTAWLGPSIGRRILGGWIIGLVVLVGIPTTASLGLPPVVTILCVVAELAVGLLVLLGSLRDTVKA